MPRKTIEVDSDMIDRTLEELAKPILRQIHSKDSFYYTLFDACFK
jgi:hypothetical protein